MQLDKELIEREFKGFVSLNSNNEVDIDSVPEYHRIRYNRIVKENPHIGEYVKNALDSGCILAWEYPDANSLYICSGIMDNEGYPVVFMQQLYFEDPTMRTFFINDTSNIEYNVNSECAGIRIEDVKRLLNSVIKAKCCICGEQIGSLVDISPAFFAGLAHKDCAIENNSNLPKNFYD